MDVTALGPRGVGLGTSPEGHPVEVRGAPPGARVAVAVVGRSKGVVQARRTAVVRPPPDAAVPRCAIFGTCGGCALQELGLDAQRAAKHALALAQVAPPADVVVHAPRGTADAYGYRNKVELSFGPHRWLTDDEHAAGLPATGAFLGFHAPGRFDRIVDAARCELVSEPMNAILGAIRAVALSPEAPPPYDPRAGTGFWRHLLLREAGDQRLVVLYTASAELREWALRALDAVDAAGVQWRVNAGVADVARGEVIEARGADAIEERLGDVTFRLSPTAFFQTSTAGAKVLYDAVGEALGRGGTLLDLYCGTGAIGLYLASRFDRVVGVEENAESVEDARANAVRNGIPATFRAARVEDALDEIRGGDGVRIVVDPPRAGLHPKVAKKLADTAADALVYVACNPASLGRDALVLAEGGWRMRELWTVDLFPQTGHVEVVARFVRA
jgi:23S rRNA (uracil1939-C5)-methyltransferase